MAIVIASCVAVSVLPTHVAVTAVAAAAFLTKATFA